jgi:membrane protein implicated in regulation of membrane protease activity
MLTLYLACLISGAILLVISMFSGGDGDMDHGIEAHGDFDHGLEAHGDIAHSIEAQTDVAADADAGGAIEHATATHAVVQPGHGDAGQAGSDGALAAAFQFFSFRNFVYLATFFGLTGSALTYLGTGTLLTLLSSIGMGGFAMTVGHKFMRYLKDTESGQSLHERDLVGHVGVVTLPPTKERKGKIRVSIGGQTLEFLAIVQADSAREEFRFGEQALILEFEHNVAEIDVADFLGDLSADSRVS